MRKLYQPMSSCLRIAARRLYRVVIAARAKRLEGLGCFHSWRQRKSAVVNSGMVWWAVIHTSKTVRAFSQRSVAEGAGQFRMCGWSSSCSGQRGHSNLGESTANDVSPYMDWTCPRIYFFARLRTSPTRESPFLFPFLSHLIPVQV
jgi:hypothetical protein